jgi:hypothetical protein
MESGQSGKNRIAIFNQVRHPRRSSDQSLFSMNGATSSLTECSFPSIDRATALFREPDIKRRRLKTGCELGDGDGSAA